MRIVVTGGAGFIGSHLCLSLLQLGHEVVCIDNFFTSRKETISNLVPFSKFELIRHDVCDPWHIEADQIYHLACPASPVHYQKNPVRTIKTAVIGTLNALECARDTNARLVITSTSEVYGDPMIHPQSENYFGNVNPIGDRSCYDEGKRAGESLAVAWAKQYKTDIRIARLFNTYGPNMAFNDGRLIPNFVLQALNGGPLTIYGDGSQTRSFCYVSDTVRALISLMNANQSSEFSVMNIGNPDERTILSVANDIIQATNPSLSIIYEPLPSDDPKQRCPDITKAKNLLDWEPVVSYQEGISETIKWFVSESWRRK